MCFAPVIGVGRDWKKAMFAMAVMYFESYLAGLGIQIRAGFLA